jgi:hypothetical protein
MNWNPFGRKTKANLAIIQNYRRKMEELGLGVYSGEQLEWRLNKWRGFDGEDGANKIFHRQLKGKTPEEKLKDLRMKLEETDTIVREVSLAWMRAGTDKDFAKGFMAYEELLGHMQTRCDILEPEISGEATREKETLLQQLNHKCMMCFFNPSRFLCDISFRDADISLSRDRTVVMQNQMMPQYGGMVTPAGTFNPTNPKPSNKPIPAELSSEIEEEE